VNLDKAGYCARRPQLRGTHPEHPEENLVRTALVGGVLATLSLTTMAATGALAGGNGAARSGLSPMTTDDSQQCEAGSGAGENGFAIVNAPGKPGEARFVNGEVSLKNGAPNATYMVKLSDGDACLPEGMLTTNGQGNGNAHLNDATLTGGGTFFVVLVDASTMKEAYATAPVTVN
jgi:hypothetical protein